MSQTFYNHSWESKQSQYHQTCARCGLKRISIPIYQGEANIYRQWDVKQFGKWSKNRPECTEKKGEIA